MNPREINWRIQGDELVREVFKRLSDRLDAIEARGIQSAAEITAIREELRPQTLDKPVLGKKTPGAGP